MTYKMLGALLYFAVAGIIVMMNRLGIAIWPTIFSAAVLTTLATAILFYVHRIKTTI
ncbi:hypothetical protein SAMN05877809_1152 [Rhodobacter sp. JA431]|nr:hypothetical protein SAMN05877809_1152 [Rhodobacter sp. JA431]